MIFQVEFRLVYFRFYNFKLAAVLSTTENGFRVVYVIDLDSRCLKYSWDEYNDWHSHYLSVGTNETHAFKVFHEATLKVLNEVLEELL